MSKSENFFFGESGITGCLGTISTLAVRASDSDRESKPRDSRDRDTNMQARAMVPSRAN